MDLRTDARRLAAPWRDHPRRQAHRHARACIRALVPTDENNDFRKLLGLGLFLLWCIVTLVRLTGNGGIGEAWYALMTAVVYTIIGIQWGFELDNLPIQANIRTDDQNDGDG
jgi:hypothetical protein